MGFYKKWCFFTVYFLFFLGSGIAEPLSHGLVSQQPLAVFND